MRQILFLAVVVSAATLVGALILSIAQPTVSVWPAPQENERAWRVRLIVHRVAGTLVALAGTGTPALPFLTAAVFTSRRRSGGSSVWQSLPLAQHSAFGAISN